MGLFLASWRGGRAHEVTAVRLEAAGLSALRTLRWLLPGRR